MTEIVILERQVVYRSIENGFNRCAWRIHDRGQRWGSGARVSAVAPGRGHVDDRWGCTRMGRTARLACPAVVSIADAVRRRARCMALVKARIANSRWRLNLDLRLNHTNELNKTFLIPST
jgi:hypothetical protein